jgi:hypothetical protein
MIHLLKLGIRSAPGYRPRRHEQEVTIDTQISYYLYFLQICTIRPLVIGLFIFSALIKAAVISIETSGNTIYATAMLDKINIGTLRT